MAKRKKRAKARRPAPASRTSGTPAPARERSGSRAAWAVALSVALFATLLYSNTARNGFVLDDTSLVLENRAIRSLGTLPSVFTSDYWEHEIRSGLYRPLTTLSYSFNYLSTAAEPAPYHWVNIALHAANSLLVLLLFRRVAARELTAAVGAFFFAAHAIHTEAVANIAGRSELLCTFFFLSSLVAYIAARVHPRPAALYATSLAAYLAALLCKENAVTLLGVIVLYDLLFRGSTPQPLLPRLARLLRHHGLRLYGGFVATTVFYLGVRWLVLGGGPAVHLSHLDNPLTGLAAPWRILTALQVAFRYLGLLVFPLHLSYDYSYNQIPLLTSLIDPRSLLVLGLSAVAAGALVWSYRASKAVFFALGFGVITFSIVSNLVLPIGTIMAERLLYLPSVGFSLAVALVGRALCVRLPLSPRRAAAVFGAGLGLVVALNGWRSVVRNGDWVSDEVLLVRDLEVSPGSAKVQYNAGVIFYGEQRYGEAVERLKTAVRIEPEYPDAQIELGHALVGAGRKEEAMAVYDHVVARGWVDGQAYNNFGYHLVEEGIDLERGVLLLEQAVQTQPENPHFLDSLGWAYYKAGRLQEAYEHIARSLAIEDTGASGQARRAHLEEVQRELDREAAPREPSGSS